MLLASYENQIDVLEVLIQHGAQLDVQNEVTIIKSVTICTFTCYCALMNLLIVAQIVIFIILSVCRQG